MNAIRRFIGTVPPWALMLVLLVVVVNSLFLYYRQTSEVLWLLVGMYIINLLFSLGSLYLIYKKPGDSAARVFFIYLQLFSMASNAGGIPLQEPAATFITIAFFAGNNLSVAALIHFHLIFPRPSLIYARHKGLPWIFYSIGFLVLVINSLIWIVAINSPSAEHDSINYLTGKYLLIWMILAVSIALGLAVYQFNTIKSTLARNQVRIVIIGSLFGFITPITDGIFFDYIENLLAKNPWLLHFTHGPASLIMATCFLVAIFRYRIWGTEIFIRKALLYLSATFVITLTYLLLIFLVDKLTISETNFNRFIIMAVSVIVFLVLRDSIQHLIERFFHRESYDSATVVSDFEAKLAGIYQSDELKSKIVQGLDEIFHFKSFVFNLKKNELIYEPAFVLGIDSNRIDKEFEVTRELENLFRKSKVFSPEELQQKPSILEHTNGELVVPLLKDDHPFGFFICGKKKSEKTYSLQDIRVLALIAKRVIALFQTAALYEKNLDRQLMLERERARISQDMHDDIGAGLTKIAMISEAKTSEQDKVSSEQMLKVATTARDMINRLNVIVWALNPRYDNLDSLVSYVRRYFGEYLENFGIDLKMQISGEIPDLPVSPDFRRNAFYAWQEAIHNAVKHSACSEIKIEMKIKGQILLVTIIDNGKGFDHAKPGSGGNGLHNMKKRAEELGGSFEIQSMQGKGTRVVFVIPVWEK